MINYFCATAALLTSFKRKLPTRPFDLTRAELLVVTVVAVHARKHSRNNFALEGQFDWHTYADFFFPLFLSLAFSIRVQTVCHASRLHRDFARLYNSSNDSLRLTITRVYNVGRRKFGDIRDTSVTVARSCA